MTKTYTFENETLTLSCQDTEHTVGLIQKELSTYKSLFKINFQKDDVILDLGANLGIISIFHWVFSIVRVIENILKPSEVK